ncbi:MAG: hypothetical protein AAF928_05195 [Myxococcota bacterium]
MKGPSVVIAGAALFAAAGLIGACGGGPVRPVSSSSPAVEVASASSAEEEAGAQALYDADGRPRVAGVPPSGVGASDAARVVYLRDAFTRVPTARQRAFDGVGRARPPRVGRRDVRIRSARLDNALRLLAEEGRFDLVVAEPLGDAVDLRLSDIEPFDALQVVARTHGLVVHYAGDIVTVAPRGAP